MQNQTKITIIITALLIILMGGYIYKNTSSKKVDEGLTATSTPKVTNKTDGDYQIDFEYADDVIIDIKPITDLKIPTPPELNKNIVFNVEMSDDQKTKAINKLNEIIDRLKKDSGSFDDWINLGSNRKMIGDYVGAVEAWRYASLISPLNIVPLNNLGNLYHYQLKNYTKSEEYFKKAVSAGSNYPSSYINLFDLYSLSYKQETNSAEKIILEGLENNPNQINLLMTLATYYRDKGNNKEAIRYYEKTAQQAQKTGNIELYSELQNQISLLK